MAKISMEQIQELRERTGLGMLDCKKALEETNGDMEQALVILRKKGAKIAEKRSGNATSEGVIHAYIHPGSRVGVMIEINCETDFVACTDEIKQLANDLCMQIAALRAKYVSPENVDQEFLARERDIYKAEMSGSGKPEKIVDQIVEGKINKLLSEVCLIKQSFIKNDQLTIEDLLKDVMGKVGENVRIKRFARYELGE